MVPIFTSKGEHSIEQFGGYNFRVVERSKKTEHWFWLYH